MFDYDVAFSRNLGWLSKQEQNVLKGYTVAIAGAGGVGGEYAVTLARLGVGHIKIADFDVFELHNMNRQAGCFMSTLASEKCQTMKHIIQDINPSCRVDVFGEGIYEHNIEDFINDVNVYIDGIDFFVLKERFDLFEICEQRRIPVITVAPLGTGSSMLCFSPDSLPYKDYFAFSKTESNESAQVRFIAGVSPSMQHRHYLVAPEYADFHKKVGPSLPMGVKACASMAATAVMKFALKRGKVLVAPHTLHFDPYNNTLKKCWRPFGNKNPLQLLLMRLVKRKLKID